MDITAEHIKKEWELDPQNVAKVFAETLRDFGYRSLTNDWVEAEIKRLYEGGEPGGGPSMFLGKWLKEGVEE